MGLLCDGIPILLRHGVYVQTLRMRFGDHVIDGKVDGTLAARNPQAIHAHGEQTDDYDKSRNEPIHPACYYSHHPNVLPNSALAIRPAEPAQRLSDLSSVFIRISLLFPNDFHYTCIVGTLPDSASLPLIPV
jgi:hypothetical protein